MSLREIILEPVENGWIARFYFKIPMMPDECETHIATNNAQLIKLIKRAFLAVEEGRNQEKEQQDAN